MKSIEGMAMRGYLEDVDLDKSVVKGWAWDPENQISPNVTCKLNGVIVGTARLSGTRADLTAKVSPSENLLYTVRLSKPITSDDILTHRFVVEISSLTHTAVAPLSPVLTQRLVCAFSPDVVPAVEGITTEDPNDKEASGSSADLTLGMNLRNRTPGNTPAAGLATADSIGESNWVGQETIKRYVVDMSQETVDPTPPASLLRCLTVPLGNPMRAADIMLPDSWTLDSQPVEAPSIWLLENAHVMGGEITGRNAQGQLGGQLVLANDGSMIPASYAVMDGNKELSIDRLELRDGSHYLKQVPPSNYRKGTFFLIGAANNHFGHTILEGLTRLWGTKFLHPSFQDSVQFIVYESYLRQHTRDLLELAGITRERIVHASPHDIVERLIVPDTAMRTHRSITKFQANVWETMGSQFDTPSSTRKVFLSRRKASDRRLKNELAIEECFAEYGYEIVIPEELTVHEQVRLARESYSLAGCVGSQMYLSCFQKMGSHNVIIAPRNFFLKDDVLISRAKNIDIEIVLGSKVDFHHPKDQMDWTVDQGAVENALRMVN